MPTAKAQSDPRELTQELVRRSVEMILPQTRASTPIAILVGGMYGFIFVPAVGWLWYALWYAAVAAGFLGRQVYFERLLRRDGANRRSLFLIAVVSAFTGWVSTLSIALFSPHLSIADLGVLTIIMVGTVTVAVSILAVQPRVYLAYVVACLINVFIAWAAQAEPRDIGFIGASLVLGGSLLVKLGFLLAAQLRETVDMSLRNADLVTRLQRALESEQEAQRARSRFLGAASHDLRQPVQALLFLIDLFRNAHAAGPDAQLAGQIVRTAESIDAMFRHLVDYAQIDAGTLKAQLQPVDLPRLAAAAASGFAEKCGSKGLAFRLEPFAPCTVSADPVLLERLLRNFLDNAWKYSREGTIAMRAWIDGAQAVVEVRDQGVGMDAGDVAQAFKAFYRGRSAAAAEAEGIGLGLAICKYVAREMHAELRLDSRVGEGTTVAIHLPLAGTQQAGAAPPLDAGTLRGLTVVVLEDDKLARDALCLWIRERGAQVLAAASLRQLLPQLAGRASPPDLIVADFRLAEGDGVQAVAALRAEHGDIPAILLSGERSVAGIRTDIPILQKPVSPQQVLRRVEALLSAHRASQEEEDA